MQLSLYHDSALCAEGAPLLCLLTVINFVNVESTVSAFATNSPSFLHPLCLQLPASEVKKIPGPITPEGPKEVPGQKSLTQELNSGAPPVNEKPETRGL